MAPVDPDIAAALDKLMRSDLEAWSNLWFWVLVWSTIAVAVGIVLEAPEVFHAVGFGQKRIRRVVTRIRSFWNIRVRRIDLNGWQRLCPELVADNKGHWNWIAVWGLLGWSLVAAGVAGEGFAEYFVNDAETSLRAFDHAVLVETHQSANSAAAAASIANTFAGKAVASSSVALAIAHTAASSLAKAEADAGKAQAGAANALTAAADAASGARKAEASLGKAEADAESAESSASDALTLAQEAKREAASFERDLRRLKKQAEDRALDEFQQENIASKVRLYLGSPYELGAVDTGEAEKLLLEVDAALTSAGWIYKESADKSFRFVGHLRNGKQFEMLHGGHGIEIGFSKELEQRLKPAAEALIKALIFEGIPASTTTLPDSDPSPNNIHIAILGKP